MIIKVRVDDQTYEVEIEDLHKRPIIAVVEGEEFEIWPEGLPNIDRQQVAVEQKIQGQHLSPPTLPLAAQAPSGSPTAKITESTQPPQNNSTLLAVRAPIPGVITAVNAHAGAEVAVGQQLCVLEAMKMNNSIRSSRAGRIAAVHITVGQHVKHHDILFEYAE